METAAGANSIGVPTLVPTRLEGMETSVYDKDREKVLQVPTRLEGMETSTVQRR